MPDKKQVAIYTRVSTLDQAREGYSLAAQRKILTEWCLSRSYDVYGYYADEGISAKDITHRPDMQRLLRDVQENKFDIVLVWALSRFTRSVADLYDTCTMFNSHNIDFVSCTEGFNTNTPAGRAMMGILGVFAQMEREITSERVKMAMAERAAQGKRTCSHALGYVVDGKDTFAIDDCAADVVREIYDMYLKYHCLLAVADLLNSRGVRGCNGAAFTAESVKKILTRPIYVGYYKYHGKIYHGNHEPIVKISTWNAVQKSLKKPTLNQLKNL